MSNVVCPSGLSGSVRKLKILEANQLADETNRRKDEALDGVLRSCWLETNSPGPYALKDGAPVWDDVLLADRFVAILDLRVATYGSAYEFKLACEAPDCRQRFAWSLDLVTDLPRFEIPASSIDVFRDGNRFDGHLPGVKRPFVFRLQDGRGEKAAAKMLKVNKARKLTIALASRIVEIDGVHANDKLRFIDALDMDDVASAFEQMDAVDGGVQTKIEVQCEHCGQTQEVELPLGTGFWLPIRRSARSVTTSSPGAST